MKMSKVKIQPLSRFDSYSNEHSNSTEYSDSTKYVDSTEKTTGCFPITSTFQQCRLSPNKMSQSITGFFYDRCLLIRQTSEEKETQSLLLKQVSHLKPLDTNGNTLNKKIIVKDISSHNINCIDKLSIIKNARINLESLLELFSQKDENLNANDRLVKDSWIALLDRQYSSESYEIFQQAAQFIQPDTEKNYSLKNQHLPAYREFVHSLSHTYDYNLDHHCVIAVREALDKKDDNLLSDAIVQSLKHIVWTAKQNLEIFEDS